jgi:hypothetical protein
VPLRSATLVWEDGLGNKTVRQFNGLPAFIPA